LKEFMPIDRSDQQSPLTGTADEPTVCIETFMHPSKRQEGRSSMGKETCNFLDLEPDMQHKVLPVFADHLQRILGPLEGISTDINPELIKYFIFKLEPVFNPDGRIVEISSKYEKLTRDLYTKIFGGFQHETREPGTPPEIQ
jgi:hypothetical protein